MKIHEINDGGYDWREAGELPTLGEGSFNISWLMQALEHLAAAGGPPHRSFSVNGSFEGSFNKLLDDIQALAPELKFIRRDGPNIPAIHSNDQDADNTVCAFLYYDRGGIFMSADQNNLSANVASNSPEFIAKMSNFFKERISAVPPAGSVYALVQTQAGMEVYSIGVISSALERSNYTPEVLEAYDRVVTDLKSKSPAGRIAIFEGEPGTGKTYLIRALLTEVISAVFLIVPSNLVSQLAQPSMIHTLVHLRRGRGEVPMVFIVEDADECLSPRMNDNMSSIASVLNFSDGILGALLDVRIMATTNAKKGELDSAILRPGRLSALAHVRELSPEQAQAVYTRLTGKTYPFTFSTTLAEIYSRARDNGWVQPTAKAAMGFVTPTPPSIDSTTPPHAYTSPGGIRLQG